MPKTGVKYDYWCDNCKKHFEIIIPMKYSDSLIPCKYCKKDMQKIIGAPVFHVCPRSASDKRDFR